MSRDDTPQRGAPAPDEPAAPSWLIDECEVFRAAGRGSEPLVSGAGRVGRQTGRLLFPFLEIS